MNAAVITRHLVIRGRVQGVYFRDSMRRQARRLNVTGWVRNRADGTVEATVQGEPEAVATIIEWARQGPATAKVTDVKVEEAQGQFDSFDLRATA